MHMFQEMLALMRGKIIPFNYAYKWFHDRSEYAVNSNL